MRPTIDRRQLRHASRSRHQGTAPRLHPADDKLHPLARPEQFEQLERIEQAAAIVAHDLGPMRLALGDAINALSHAQRYHDLGFSSLAAYAVERSGKPKRWVAESRALAARLESLTLIRRQLVRGRLPWTRAELLAKLVERSLAVHEIDNHEAAAALRPALELSWLFRSATLTCRELSEQLRSLQAPAVTLPPAEGFRCLTLTVPSEDAYWFHSAERVFRRVAERTDLDAFLEALLAESHNTLECRTVIRETEGLDAQDRWRSELAQWRTRAEHLCERGRRVLPDARSPGAAQPPSARPTPKALRTWSALALDEHVRAIARLLSTNAAELGRLAEKLHRVQAWRQLGFASQGHYARERLGVSLSSLKQKRALARRLVVLPRLARALEQGQLGSVAASLVARVATSKTERRWVERARQRTLKHLREEVSFVERVLRRRPGHPGWPPAAAVMRAELALQGDLASGRRDERLLRDEREIRNYELGTDACCPRHTAHAPPHPPRAAPQNPTGAYGDGDGDGGSGARARSGTRCTDNVDATTPGGATFGSCVSANLSARRQTSGHESSANCGTMAQSQTRGAAAEPAENPSLTQPVSGSSACPRGPRQCTAEGTQNHRAWRAHPVGDGLALGKVRLRMRIHESTLLLYREVARAYARHHPTRRLLRGLCEHFLAVWSPAVSGKRKYEHIYERDGYTCTSPVCQRHDVTPHHLRFRSRGGGEEPENLTSLCVWCHLEGVHGGRGRLKADPQADGIHWTIGRIAPLRVIDRDRLLQ